MDSLTQIVLGIATAELVAGKKLQNKTFLYGAMLGTIPDLDIVHQTIRNLYFQDRAFLFTFAIVSLQRINKNGRNRKAGNRVGRKFSSIQENKIFLKKNYD